MEAKCLAIAHAELGGIAVHRAAHRWLLEAARERTCNPPPGRPERRAWRSPHECDSLVRCGPACRL